LQRREQFRLLGSVPAGTGEVLAEWQKLHERLREYLAGDTEGLRKALDVNARHLRTHITIIERLLRRKPASAGAEASA
jgi:hypothetical protein